jgi:hypothetical protein
LSGVEIWGGAKGRINPGSGRQNIISVIKWRIAASFIVVIGLAVLAVHVNKTWVSRKPPAGGHQFESKNLPRQI